MLADPTLRILKGLGQGNDGVTRFEFIELQRKVREAGRLLCEKVAIHEDGTVVINNNQDAKMSLEEFLAQEHIETFGQLIARFDSVTMVDPKINVLQELKKTMNVNDAKVLKKYLEDLEATFKQLTPAQIAEIAAQQGREKYSEYQKGYGEADFGNQLHHIVEQNEYNTNLFRPKMIQNPMNIVEINKFLHILTWSYYNSKPQFTHGLTVREWLRINKPTYIEQYLYGIQVMKDILKDQFGV